jgi:hypothetical protein
MSFLSFILFSSTKSKNKKEEQVLALGLLVQVGWGRRWGKCVGR